MEVNPHWRWWSAAGGQGVDIVAKQAGKFPGCQIRVESSRIKLIKDPVPHLGDLFSQSFPTFI